MQYNEDGSLSVRGGELRRLLRSFGESDYLNQIKQLSNVYSTSDYASGISVDGSEGSQSLYLIGGAPVIFPYRFGGIFSTFNTPHFSSMKFSRISSPRYPDRLGASFLFIPAHRFKPGIEGEANVGMTSSSLTIRGGMFDRVCLNISGRVSYVDQLYGKVLRNSSSYLQYGFYDLNADLIFRLSEADQLTFSLFHSNDKLGYDDNNYALDTHLHWKNSLYNIGYAHDGKVDLEANIYRSVFNNNLTFRMPQFHILDPSSFTTNGGHFHLGQVIKQGVISDWVAGIRGSYDMVSPQWAVLTMTDASGNLNHVSVPMDQKLWTLSLFSQVGLWLFPERLKLIGEGSVGIYSSNTVSEDLKYRRGVSSISTKFQLLLPDGQVTLSTGMSQQPVHQVGFSELGLASNFWIGACDRAPIQRACFVNLHFRNKLPWWNLTLESSAYWKKLWNQTEYQGSVIEAVDVDYNPFSHIIVSDGYSYGFSIGVSRQFGNLTGDLSYSYGDGWRHSRGGDEKPWHSLYSEGSVAKCNVVWHEGRHWVLSASWRISAGRRFTPVEALYAIGGNIAMQYGERNSARLPSYQRLDLGATYFFTRGKERRFKHSVNVSLLNAYGHRNVEMQYFVLNSENGSYSLKKLYSLYRFLPSISYSIEF